MNHPQDLKIDKNFYVCSKQDYYCPDIFGTPVVRKIERKKTHKSGSILRSSSNSFPFSFVNNNHTYTIGGKTKEKVEDWWKNQEMKKLCVLDKFLMFILRFEMQNQVVLAHNAGKFGKFFFI